MQRASSQHWSLLRYSATLPIAIYSIASAGSLVGSFFAQLFSFSTEGLPNDVSRVSSFSPSYARAVVGEEILLSLFNIVPLLSLSCPVCCPDFLEIGLYLSKLQSFMIVCAVPFGVLFSIIPCFSRYLRNLSTLFFDHCHSLARYRSDIATSPRRTSMD